MTTNVQPPGSSQQGSSMHVADREARARARTAIGLEPDRDTAPDAYLRPPDQDAQRAQWLLVGGVVLLGIAVLMLLLASLFGPNSTLTNLFGTRISVDTGVVPPTAAAPALPAFVSTLPGYQLWMTDEFTATSPIATAGAGTVGTGLLAEGGVYRMTAMPGQLGWTLFDLAQNTSYHLETGATVAPDAPAGAAGIIARFGGAGNFYLLAVDGAGTANVQLWRDGVPYTVQGMTVPANPAGQANRLAVADDGQRLRFYANQVLVAEVLAPQLPFGRPGLAVVAPGALAAVVDYDWIAIYRAEE